MEKPPELSPAEAYEAIQRLLHECDERLGLPDHARDRMLERNVNNDDILNVLRNGTVSQPEWNETRGGHWRYPVSGLDIDGAPLVVVIVLEPKFCRITIVTVKDKSQ